MTPKTATPAQLADLADMLDDDGIYEVVVGLVAKIRDAYPRVRNAHNESLDVDSGKLGNELIAELRRVSTEIQSGRNVHVAIAEGREPDSTPMEGIGVACAAIERAAVREAAEASA